VCQLASGANLYMTTEDDERCNRNVAPHAGPGTEPRCGIDTYKGRVLRVQRLEHTNEGAVGIRNHDPRAGASCFGEGLGDEHRACARVVELNRVAG
jgi:hypothetical protein